MIFQSIMEYWIEIFSCFLVYLLENNEANMNKNLKNRIFDGFFSIGSLNTRPVSTYKVNIEKRLIDSDNIRIIRVPTLSESLGESFDNVDSLMFSAEKELVHG